MTLAEEDELSEQLKDVTVNRSQPEENHIEVFVPLPAKKRIQWPPAYHEINVGSVDSNSNVQQSVIDEQLNDIDLKETTETTCDQLDEVTNNPDEESVMEETQIDSSVSSELNSNGKVIFIGYEIPSHWLSTSVNKCMPILIWFLDRANSFEFGILPWE